LEKVAINFGKPGEECLDALTVAEAKQYMAENQFAKGSMLPKVEAAISFVAPHGGTAAETRTQTVIQRTQAVRRTALITLLQKAKEGIEGKTGTVIRN
jgi:carbamate kinase